MAGVDIHLRVKDEKAAANLRRFAQSAGIQFKRLGKTTASTSKTMGRFNQLIGPLGLAGGLSVLTLGLKAAVGSAMEFETAMAEVSTLVDTSTTNMGGLSDAILDLSTRVPKSAVDLSRGLYQTISSGVTDAGEAMKVLEVGTKAATAGITDTNTAVSAIVTVLNSYGMSTRDASKVSDLLFSTVREGMTTFRELAPAIGTVVSSAALAEVSFDQLSAAIATITKGGIDTNTTVTALNRLFLSIANPTDQLREKAKEMGFEFSAAALRTKGFGNFIAELTEKFKDDKDAIFALGLDVRAFRALSILGGTGAEEFAEQLGKMEKAAEATEKAFEKMNSTSENQWAIVKNKLGVSLNKLWISILPGVIGVAQVASSKVDNLSKGFELLFGSSEDASMGIARVSAETRRMAQEMSDFFTKIEETGGIDKIVELQGRVSSISSEIKTKQEEVAALYNRQRVTLDDAFRITQLTSDEVAEAEENFRKTQESTLGYANNTRTAHQVMIGTLGVAQQLKNVFDSMKRSTGGLLGGILGGVAGFITGGPGGALAGSQLGSSLLSGFKHGGSFIVPGQGSGDRPFMMNLAPGERVDVTPRERVTNNNMGPVNISITTQTVDENFVRTKLAPIMQRLSRDGNVSFGMA